MSVNEGGLKGGLKKWSKFRYQVQWFKMSPSSAILECFREEEDLSRTEESVVAMDKIVVTDSILVDTDYDGENRYFSLIDNKSVWYLEAGNREEKKMWIYNLTGKGARRMTLAEFKKFQSHGELIPSLNFPTVKGEHTLNMEKEGKTILEKSYSLIVTGFENVASAGLPFVSGTTLIPLAAGGAVIGGAKVYNFFQKPDLDQMEKNLENKIHKEIFRNNLIRLQSEISATERRYKMIISSYLTDTQKEIEVTIAMHSFETILRLFHLPGNSFLENAFMMAPYLASFSTLYLLFSQVAIQVHPAYKITIIEGINALENCLLLYKETAIKQRLNGITLNSFRLSRYDYVRDEKYPSIKDGLQNRFAYVDYEKYQDSKQFFNEYTGNIRDLYSAYFNQTIDNIKLNKSKLVEFVCTVEPNSIKGNDTIEDKRLSVAETQKLRLVFITSILTLFISLIYYLFSL